MNRVTNLMAGEWDWRPETHREVLVGGRARGGGRLWVAEAVLRLLVAPCIVSGAGGGFLQQVWEKVGVIWANARYLRRTRREQVSWATCANWGCAAHRQHCDSGSSGSSRLQMSLLGVHRIFLCVSVNATWLRLCWGCSTMPSGIPL